MLIPGRGFGIIAEVAGGLAIAESGGVCDGAWPSGKAPGFGPGIAGSNPAAPARGFQGPTPGAWMS